MKFLQRGVALALLAAFTLASETAQAYEQDKTYKITVLHTNDHHGHFWRNEYGEYGLAAQKTLVDGIRKKSLLKVVACCYFLVATLTPVYRNPTYRMLNLIFAA